MRRPGPPRDIPPPLEMLCLKALWSLGEGSVSEVRSVVAAAKPLAYTTVMTVLDRLSRKNMVSRRKVGRAYLYVPGMSRDVMRHLALKEFIDTYFDGSTEKLTAFLGSPSPVESVLRTEPESAMDAALL
jgi:BlaI family penicillinase repressor